MMCGVQGLFLSPPMASAESDQLESATTGQESVPSYYLRVRGLDETALQEELSRLERVVSAQQRADDRIRLVILLSLPTASFKDYDRSLALLGGLLENPAGLDAASTEEVLLLADIIGELKRRDERIQKLDLRLKAEKKQRKVLQQKLDELTTIERSLLERERQESP